MSYLLLYGKSRPAFDLSFLSGSLSQSVTFSRASTKNVFDRTGVLVNAASGTPAYSFDPVTGGLLGLSYEPQRTNSVTRSWRLGSWANNASSSTTDSSFISPDGTQNASTIVATATNQGRYLTLSGLSTDTYYAVSGFVTITAGPMTKILCGANNVEGGSGNGHLIITAATGAVASATNAYGAYSVLLPNGWTYFRYYVKTGSSQTSFSYVCYANGGAGSFSLWGAQVEALGASIGNGLATSPITTDGSAATRAADQLSFTVPAGVNTLRCVFDDKSRQDIAVAPGALTLSTGLNRACVRQILSI